MNRNTLFSTLSISAGGGFSTIVGKPLLVFAHNMALIVHWEHLPDVAINSLVTGAIGYSIKHLYDKYFATPKDEK